MSEVISFRLNRENPREALALEVLKNRFRKGFSVRYVLTEALLKLDESEDASKNISYNDLKEALHQVNQLLEQIGGGHNSTKARKDEPSTNSKLTANFINSIKKAAKPGVKQE